jgi:hypothetical protein
MSNPYKNSYSHSIKQTEADLALFQKLLNQFKWRPTGDNFFFELDDVQHPNTKKIMQLFLDYGRPLGGNIQSDASIQLGKIIYAILSNKTTAKKIHIIKINECDFHFTTEEEALAKKFSNIGIKK